MTVTRKGIVVEFQTDLGDSEALSALVNVPGDFARDLYAKRHNLTDRQMAWVHKLVVDQRTPRAPIAGVDADLSGAVKLFARATALKYPKITIALPSGATIRLQLAGAKSRYPGTIAVTDEQRYPHNRYFGRIENDGKLTPGRDLTDEIRAALVELSADPVAYARAYGVRTGCCCFCNKPLDDERSTAEGYGPVCAKKWSLPWGKTSPAMLALAAA